MTLLAVLDLYKHLQMDSTPSDSGESLQDTFPTMNPADLQAALWRQGIIIHAYQVEVETLKATNQLLQQQAQIQAVPPTPTPPHCSELPHMALPEKFDGSTDHCRGFLHQSDNFLAHQAELYGADTTRCAFMLSLLMGKALDWASAVWDSDLQVKTPMNYFTGLISEVFNYPVGGKDISVQLLELCQGSEPAAEYAIKFCTLTMQSGWNVIALQAVFREGLNPALQAEMADKDTNMTLSQYNSTAIRLDNLSSSLQPMHSSPTFDSHRRSTHRGGISHMPK